MRLANHELANLNEFATRCWCSKHGEPFGLAFRRAGARRWELLHAYSANPYYPAGESSDHATGQFCIASAYSGCIFCENKEVIQCGACNAFSCGGHRSFGKARCALCGNQAAVSGRVQSEGVSSCSAFPEDIWEEIDEDSQMTLNADFQR